MIEYMIYTKYIFLELDNPIIFFIIAKGGRSKKDELGVRGYI